jgi:hypothetical protein
MNWATQLFRCPGWASLVWAFDPIAASRRLRQISASRLRSVPVNVVDWTDVGTVAGSDPQVVFPGEPDSAVAAADTEAIEAGPAENAADSPKRSSGKPVPDEQYPAKLREHVAGTGGVTPSAREIAWCCQSDRTERGGWRP